MLRAATAEGKRPASPQQAAPQEEPPAAPNHKLALPHHVYLYDAHQPIGNPKPSWLLVAKFNEKVCAEMYVEAYKTKYPYAKHMKIETQANGR